MYKGSCLCGLIQFELKSEPKNVSHCQCTMCQKQHGAAFATYGSVPKVDLHYSSGEENLASYHSSRSIYRKFCRNCGSSIEWGGSERFPDWASIAIATLDTDFSPESIADIHTDTRVCWLEVE